MEFHAPKEPRIAEDKRLLLLLQDKVIVLGWPKVCRLRAERSAHSEMQAHPITAREFEEHLLAAGGGTEQPAAG